MHWVYIGNTIERRIQYIPHELFLELIPDLARVEPTQQVTGYVPTTWRQQFVEGLLYASSSLKEGIMHHMMCSDAILAPSHTLFHHEGPYFQFHSSADSGVNTSHSILTRLWVKLVISRNIFIL